MNILLKTLAALGIVFLIVTVGYKFFVLDVRQQQFSNCLKSYSSEWQDFVTKEILISPADLCMKSVNFSVFTKTVKEAKAEARSQYADPDNYWIKEKVEKDIAFRTRSKLGFDF